MPEIKFSVVLRMAVLLLSILLVPACQTLPASTANTNKSLQKAGNPAGADSWRVIDFARLPTLDDIIDALADKRIIFIGESHERYDHHLGQLEIIKRLHARNPDLVIGLEQIQQPFQQALDDYIAGRIDETTMLRNTEYYDRWKFDYRLYRPIFLYARQHHIPLLALNVSREITQAVGKGGIKALSAEQREQIPTSIDRNVAGYRDRIESVFGQHPGMEKRSIDNFVEAQLIWDEGMAEAAAAYLHEHPEKTMVILAGAGHIMEGTGIPQRLQRRTNLPMATVLQLGSGIELAADTADYILLPKEQVLPPAGLIGVILLPADHGMKINSFSDDSRAREAGLRVGDKLVEINGSPIERFSDVRLGLWNRKPGDHVTLGILRGDGDGAKRLDFEVILK